MSLPTATLIWHCPFLTIFYSSDKKVFGKNYREFSLIRIDGEYWESDEAARNEMLVDQSKEFKGWEDWKERNKNVIIIMDDTQDVYAALTGDQVALTDIRINNQ